MSTVTGSAVIVAAGRGERFGLAAKSLVQLAGRPLLTYSLDAADRAECIADIIVVAADHTRAEIERIVAFGAWQTPMTVVRGGAERQHSVRAGAHATSALSDVVVIHDAARPLVDADDIDRCAQAAYGSGAAILAAPVVDTIKRVHNEHIVETVPRDDLWSAQTPQAFRRAALLAALRSEIAEKQTFTDEAGLFEALGWPVSIVPSRRANLKITHPSDLAIAEALIGGRPFAESGPKTTTHQGHGTPS